MGAENYIQEATRLRNRLTVLEHEQQQAKHILRKIIVKLGETRPSQPLYAEIIKMAEDAHAKLRA